MNEVPAEGPGARAPLSTGASALIGVAAVWLTDRIIDGWEAREPGTQISASKRRWISLATPAALVLLGYAGALAGGRGRLTWPALYGAVVNAAVAACAKQVVYAALASANKPAQVTNIGTVQADRDLYLGSTITPPADPPDTATPSEGGRYMNVTKEKSP